MNLWDVLADASPVNQLILLMLVLLSVVSWAVIIERWRYYRAAGRADAKFFEGLKGRMETDEVYRLARVQTKSPSGRAFVAASMEMQRLKTGDLEAWDEMLDLERNTLRSDAERGLPMLAIVASAAPFIGLLGTVWGVMIAFLKLGGMEGQPALEVVGPGIAEALIATAAGLFAAIPATIAYNVFVAARRKLLRRNEEFNRRLLVMLDKGAAEEAR